MNKIKSFKIFEEAKLNKYDELMGKLLHLYGSIPLPKQKASVVISKIIYNTNNGKYYKLGDDVNIKHQLPHDKVRFKDYFDSLIKSKDSRGHNYEGTVAALYNGELSTRGEKWDLVIDNKTWSVKFIDKPSKAPEIGSFKKVIKENNLDNIVSVMGGLTRLFRNKEEIELKSKVFDILTKEITGGWIIAYPSKVKKSQVTEKKKEGDLVIKQHIISVSEMKEMFMDGMSVAPKGGFKSYYSLALSAKFKIKKHTVCDIIIPKLDINELRNIAKSHSEVRWSEDIFGEIGRKIRPDVIRHIKSNSKEIGKKLISYKDFKNKY